MPTQQQQLTFAIKAVNEASAAIRDVQGDLDKLGGSGETAGSKLGGLKSGLGDVSKIAGGFVLAQGLTKLPGVMSDLSGTAKDLELQQKKITTVFGDQLPVINTWADEAAHAMGLTKNEAKNLAAGAADLLIPMGFTREAATGMSTDMLGLAGALSEWSGGTTTSAEAADVLTKAMLGERDGLKSLGISISEADVQARLLEKGQKDLTGQALEQAKAQATLELVMEKSTDAQAAFADGAGSSARKQAEASARMRELKERIAVGLQPAIIAVSAFITDRLVPAFEKIVTKGMEIAEVVRDHVEGPIRALVTFLQENESILQAIGVGIATVLVVAFGAWAVAAGAAAIATIAAAAPVIALGLVIAGLGAGIFLLIKHWDSIVEKVPILGVVVDAVKTAFINLVTALEGPLTTALNAAKTVVTDVLVPGFQTLWDFITDSVLPLIVELVTALEGPFKTALEAAEGVVVFLKDGFQALWDFITDKVLPVVASVVTNLEGPLTTALNAAKTVVTDVFIPGLQLLWNFFTDKLMPIIGTAINLYLTPLKVAFEAAKTVVTDVLVPGFTTLTNFITETLLPTVNDIITKLEGPFDTAVGIGTTAVGLFKDGFIGVRDGIQWVIDKITLLVDKIMSIPEPPGWVKKGIGVATDFAGGYIPGGLFGGATGGIVTRPTLSVIGEAGPEALIPLNQAPGAMPLTLAGVTGRGAPTTVVNNYFQVNGSVVTLRELAYELKRLGPVV